MQTTLLTNGTAESSPRCKTRLSFLAGLLEADIDAARAYAAELAHEEISDLPLETKA
jgi:hypothetical protein